MSFDRTKYKIRTWKNPLMLHWIINPGLAINELLVGQRIPKIMLIEKNNKPLAERSFVPCPHCGTIHSGLKWTPQNKTTFGNWFGLYCDHCSQIMPCLTNLTSYVLLGLTFPIWIWFKDKWKAQWLQVQKERFSRPLVLTPPDFKWWYVGLRWGFFMLIFMNILKFRDFTWKGFLIDIPFWIIGGLLFGLVTKSFAGQRIKKQPDNKTQQATQSAKDSADASVRAANTADATLKDQREINRQQRISDSIKDSLDSAKYVRDTIAENRRGALNNINQQKNLETQRQSIQAQIKSLEQTQKDFELENRPFIGITNIAVDTTNIKTGFIKVNYIMVNYGRFPAKILNEKSSIGYGSDTSRIDYKTKDTTQYINDFVSNITQLPITQYMENIPDLYVYEIQKGIIGILIFFNVKYQDFGGLNYYETDLIYKITFNKLGINYKPLKNNTK